MQLDELNIAPWINSHPPKLLKFQKEICRLQQIVDRLEVIVIILISLLIGIGMIAAFLYRHCTLLIRYQLRSWIDSMAKEKEGKQNGSKTEGGHRNTVAF